MMAIVNIGVGLLIGYTIDFMINTYQDMLGGVALPAISELVLSVSWWPYIFTGVGILGAVVSGTTKIESRVLSHALCIILMLQVMGLALTAFGLCAPMYIPTPRLLP